MADERHGVTALIPREVLFGNPSRLAPRLSPDGRRLAYLAPDAGVLNVWVRTVGRGDDEPVTRDRGRGIRDYFWAQNGEQILYLQDRDGDENWSLYAVPARGGGPVDLTPRDGVQAQVVALDPRFPDEILVGLNERDRRLHDVYRLNVRTGERLLAARNDLGSVGWVADHDFNVRVAQVPTPETGFALMHRAPPRGRWKELIAWGPEDALTTSAVAFSEDGSGLYLASSVGSDTTELRLLDLETATQRSLAAEPGADLSDVLIHPTSHRVQAAAFEKSRREWRVLDPAVRGDFGVLSRLHAGDFTVVNRDRADATWLVAYVQDRGPTAYYAYDRAAGRGAFLFSARPELERVTLAEMRPVSYRARDGLTLHGYLTLPVGIEPRCLPAVLNVHGGPWARDSWGYDPESQWLANRGYACLQVNYRGSTGYGKRHINAADREWGGRMQDDLTDGVRWLVQCGIADPKRVGIYGGSYGGYAVLSGLSGTPELYACGVDIVGPSNLLTWLRNLPPYWKPFEPLIHRQVGHPERDEAFLRERSPLFHVDRIVAPLLIAQGRNDPRVRREESLRIRDALCRAGKTVLFVEFPDEGHGFARPGNRLKFYAAAERFLADHLGGRCEPETPAGI
ncbi:MAG: S9 family peptidase [Acidobacteriota bacterium]